MEELLKPKLAGALVKFQGEVPVIPKNGIANITMKSGGSYSYKYAELSDIWEAIRKPLLDNELAVTQFVRSSDTTDYIITKIWHSSGETESEPFAIPTGGKTPQEVGSVVTYYKRYALGAALGISTEEDDDAQSGNTKPSKKPIKEAFVPLIDDVNTIKRLGKDLGYEDRIVNAKIKTLTSDQAAIDMIAKLTALSFNNELLENPIGE